MYEVPIAIFAICYLTFTESPPSLIMWLLLDLPWEWPLKGGTCIYITPTNRRYLYTMYSPNPSDSNKHSSLTPYSRHHAKKLAVLSLANHVPDLALSRHFNFVQGGAWNGKYKFGNVYPVWLRIWAIEKMAMTSHPATRYLTHGRYI